MRSAIVLLFWGLLTFSVVADVQDVTVGGSLRIRGNWYNQRDLDFDNSTGNDALFVEQRTAVNVTATFTDDILAFVELDAWNVFGDSFRGLDFAGGNYALDGADNFNGTPINFYQGYVEVQNAWGTPINFRIGRQEIQLGSEFLVGNNDTSSLFRGLSFDGFTTKSHFGDFVIRSWFTELVTNNDANRHESSGDIWFQGYYVAYEGFNGMTLDGYVMHYYQALTDPLVTAGYVKTTNFYAAGLRFAGARAKFDWDVEGTYEFGDSGLPDVPNVSSKDMNTFAVTGQAGYTFDTKMQPRVFMNGVYLGGGKDTEAFNRLFSDHEYSEFIDATDLSNVWMIGGGVSAQVTESINLAASGKYLQVVEDFGAPDNSLGFEAALYATYKYSEELEFRVGYAHLFAGSGLESPQRIVANGTRTIGGAGQSDDLDYCFIETRVKF